MDDILTIFYISSLETYFLCCCCYTERPKTVMWEVQIWLLVVTCEASRFDSSSNWTSDSGFDSYWWSGSKFSNRPHRQSSFVKKRLAVVKFAFKVEFGS